MSDTLDLLNSLEAEAQAEEDIQYFVIDKDLRTITVPDDQPIVGVYSDDSVNRLHFKMPRMYGEIDLSEFTVKINYLNADGEGDLYAVTDATPSEDEIIFSWLIGRHAFVKAGQLVFNVCLRKYAADNATIIKEFNTTIQNLTVLEGLEVDPAISEEQTDMINQLITNWESRFSTAEQDAISATNAANTAADKAVHAGATAENSGKQAEAAATAASQAATNALRIANDAANAADLAEELAQTAAANALIAENNSTAAAKSAKAAQTSAANAEASAKVAEDSVSDNVLKFSTDKSSFIHVENSYSGGALIETKIYGNCEQTGSPRPDNPQPIKRVETVEVDICGSNILKIRDFGTYTTNGITYTQMIDGGIQVSGTATATAFLNLNFTKGVDTATQSAIPFRNKSLCFDINSRNSMIFMTNGYFREDGTYISMSDGQIVPDDAYRLRTYVSVSAGTTLSNMTIYPVISVEKPLPYDPETSLFYPPHIEYTTTIPLSGTESTPKYELCKLPDGTRDELIIDKIGNVTLVKNTYTKTCSSITKWNSNNGDPYVELTSESDVGVNPSINDKYWNSYAQVVCDSYVCSNSSNVNPRIYRTWNRVILFDSRFTSEDIANQILAEHPIEIITSRYTPEVIYLGNVNSLKVPEEIFNLWINTTTIPTTISTTYPRDMSKEFDDFKYEFEEIAENAGLALNVIQESVSSLQENVVSHETRLTEVESRLQILEAEGVSDVWGVQFESGSNTVGVNRLYAAKDYGKLTFATNTQQGSYPFDQAEPWKFTEFLIDFDENGNWFPIAFKQMDSTKSPNYDENAFDYDHMLRFKNSYFYRDDDNGLYIVSSTPKKDFNPFKVNPDGTVPEYIWIPVYKMSNSLGPTGANTGIAQSRPGNNPYWNSFFNHSKIAKVRSEKAYTGVSWYENFKQVMAFIELGSRDVQNVTDAKGAKLPGFSNGIYTDNHHILEAATATNTIKVDKATDFVVGQTVSICTGWITSDKVSYRIIEAVDATNLTLTLSGNPFDVELDWNVYNVDWVCGHCDSLLGHTGATILSNGKYGMKYRGIEDCWGGSMEDISDIRLKLVDPDDNTSDYYVYYCADPFKAREIQTDAPNADYVNTGIIVKHQDGYIKTCKQSELYPQLTMATAAGASSTTYFSDYMWFSQNDNRAVRSGLSWYPGARLGVSTRYCAYAASHSARYYCARLFLEP